MDMLPDELLLHIFSFVSLRDLVVLQATSSRHLVLVDSCWMELYLQRWVGDEDIIGFRERPREGPSRGGVGAGWMVKYRERLRKYEDWCNPKVPWRSSGTTVKILDSYPLGSSLTPESSRVRTHSHATPRACGYCQAQETQRVNVSVTNAGWDIVEVVRCPHCRKYTKWVETDV